MLLDAEQGCERKISDVWYTDLIYSRRYFYVNAKGKNVCAIYELFFKISI